MICIFFAARLYSPRSQPAVAAAACAALALFLSAAAPAADRLAAYPIDPAQVSVAGISSGAFMANQLHVAHSAGIMGAAMIAGGLYGCAVEAVEDDGVRALASQAMGPCTKVPFLLDEPQAYKELIDKLAAKRWIDPPAHLASARIYLFAGGSDQVVDPATVEKAAAVYKLLGAASDHITFDDKSGPAAQAGHSWVTKNYGRACDANAPPYIDDCGYDQAGAELNAIYGPGLKPPSGAATGRIAAFDQTEFAPGKASEANGLARTGYAYVPQSCEPGAAGPCRLQVVLHGCKQSAEALGDVFYVHIGVNEWADANDIVVLYPQAHAIAPEELPANLWPTAFSNANPLGCWNWWGYAGDSQYLTKKGVQIGAIWKMIERMQGK